jgi:hypothetical protein
MAKLSDTQLTILSAACQREDRNVYPITSKLTGGALDKVLNSLLAKGLIEKVSAARDQTVWRIDDDGPRFTLRATDAACDAIGIAESAPASKPEGTKPRGKADKATQGRKRADRVKAKGRAASAKAAKGAPANPKLAPGTRTGTKQDKLIAMLRRKEGATVDDVVKCSTGSRTPSAAPSPAR